MRSNLSDWSNVGIDDALWVAFKHTTGFLIGGDDEDGAGRTVHSYNDGYSEQNRLPNLGIRSLTMFISGQGVGSRCL